MRLTFRQAIERLRTWIIQNTGYTEEQVTINKPNYEILKENGKNLCLYLSGFPLQEGLKPLIRQVYVKAEAREEITDTSVRQYEDVLEDAYSLTEAIRRSTQKGLTLTPYEDAIEGEDQKVQNVYVVAFSYKMIL